MADKEIDLSTKAVLYLSQIVTVYQKEYPEKGLAEILRLISQRLCSYSNGKHWTWNYLHQILRGYLSASANIKFALEQEYRAVCVGEIPIQFEVVRVLAPVGSITDLSLVDRCSKFCTRCGASFIPNSSNHKICFRCKVKKQRPSGSRQIANH